MFHRILVPLDGSDAGRQGLTEALRLAVPWRSTLRLFHVTCAFPFALEMANPEDVESHRQSLRMRADHVLRDAGAHARKEGLTVETCMGELSRGTPASAVIEEASRSECDLIVMGTHGRSGLARALAGSNAEEVVRKSPVPVLVVHRPKVRLRRDTVKTLTTVKAPRGAIHSVPDSRGLDTSTRTLP
jgi:nucleotide-binding universal stress UspA family protein